MFGKPVSTTTEARSRVWELARSIQICMLISWDGERQRARPLFAIPIEDENAIYFLADLAGAKDEQIELFPKVSLAFSDIRTNNYVVITGRATVSSDREKISSLWSPFAKAFWDSPEDPAICLISVNPEDAEIWEGPGRVGAVAKLLSVSATGKKPELGSNTKVDL